MLRPTATAMFMLALPLVLACTSNDDASPQTYFEGLETAKATHDNVVTRDLYPSEPEETVELLNNENQALLTLIQDLEQLQPPESASETHLLALELTRERLILQQAIAGNFIVADRSFFDTNDYHAAAVTQREDTRDLWYGAICTLELQSKDDGFPIDLGCSPEDGLAMRAVERPSVDLPSGDDACNRATEPRATQIEVGQVTYAQWFNRLDKPVRLYRFEHSNERALVATLAPNSTTVQVTYIGAGWLVTDEQDNCIGGTFPQAQPVNIHIK